MSNRFKTANLVLVLILAISLYVPSSVHAASQNSSAHTLEAGVEANHDALYPSQIMNSAPPASPSFGKKSPSHQATGISPSQVKLEWNAVSNVFRYVYCYHSTEITNNVCDINDKATWISNGTSTSVQLPALLASRNYSWQVGAKLNDNSFIYANGALTAKWAFATGIGSGGVEAGIYDNTHTNWVFTGKWAASTYTGTETGPYNKTYKESREIPDYATFTFTGARVALYYTQLPEQRGVMNIYMDNSTAPTVLNQSGPQTWQKVWRSDPLTSGTHTIKLVYVSGPAVDIDAIQIFAQADTSAPAQITLSAATGTTAGTVKLQWKAVGDDAGTGTASSYLVRYSTSAITDETTWGNATPITTGVPAPKAAGLDETMTVTGLVAGQTYYFAMRAQDEQFNISTLSNSPSAIAYKDTIAPAAISGLTATSDVNAGTVILEWKAVGDDDTTGTASSYLVRYSSSSISDETTWDNAALITTGIPTPKAAGQAETMTVAGLTSGQTYYFAVRAQDEASNRGGLSNSPSALVQVPSTILYDDRDGKWTYTGSWQQTNTSGPYQDTFTYSATVGNSATFTFTGNRFTLYYLQYTNRGTMSIYIDNLTTPVATLNQNGSLTWQKSWTSNLLADTVHTIMVKHASGTYVDVDAIKTYAPPDATAPAAISGLTATSDANAGTVVLGWTAVGDDGTTAGGAAASYLVRYSPGEILTETDWDNATPVTTGIPTPKVAGQAETMTIAGLTSGQTYYFAVRAQDEASNRGGLSNSPSALVQVPSTILYDDRDAKWTYTGSWQEITSPDAYQGTFTYSATVGNSATFTFTGNRFTLSYLQYTNRGTMYIYIDNLTAPVATLNQNGSLIWQKTWTSDLLTQGDHTIMVKHASGTYVDVDAIKIFSVVE
jgi:YHS domain-containing protein